MTRTEKQIQRVLMDLELIEAGTEIEIRRTYAGYWQRSAGAWSWVVSRKIPGNRLAEICGSQWNCRQVIQGHKKKLVVVYTNRDCHYTELIVEDEKPKEEGRKGK